MIDPKELRIDNVMMFDYEITPLDNGLKGDDFEMEADATKSYVKCFLMDGDLYRSMVTVVDNSEINSKDFVLWIAEAHLALRISISKTIMSKK